MPIFITLISQLRCCCIAARFYVRYIADSSAMKNIYIKKNRWDFMNCFYAMVFEIILKRGTTHRTGYIVISRRKAYQQFYLKRGVCN